MHRRAFLGRAAAGSLGLALAARASTAHAAASSEPGSFPAWPWKSQFVYAPTDPNAVLVIGTWNLIVNGRIYQFKVSDAGGGFVTGEVVGSPTEDFVWDPVAKRIAFGRIHADGNGGTTRQDFEGYMMDVNPDDPKIRIAGTVTREAPPITNYDDPSRLTYGFYMTIDR